MRKINHSSVFVYSMAFNLNESYGAGMRKIVELQTTRYTRNGLCFKSFVV